METPLHILLADDDADDREFFSEALSEIAWGGEASFVHDGDALMRYLRDARQLPHLLFLDLNMPVKSGLECLAEIRSNRGFDGMRIAIYSTSSTDADIDATYQSGADIYIKKPNDFARLKKVIREVIQLHWQDREADIRDNYILSA